MKTVRSRAACIPSTTWQPSAGGGRPALGPWLCVPVLRRVCHFEDEEATCRSVPPRQPSRAAAGIRRTIRAKTLRRGPKPVKFVCRFFSLLRGAFVGCFSCRNDRGEEI